ncbi:hypothetical protein EDD21DRAFT_448640 [Dissophora ornata]|nr:hypothetical protein EDD21DRAFT_448640 [Dissophora ornata]
MSPALLERAGAGAVGGLCPTQLGNESPAESTLAAVARATKAPIDKYAAVGAQPPIQLQHRVFLFIDYNIWVKKCENLMNGIDGSWPTGLVGMQPYVGVEVDTRRAASMADYAIQQRFLEFNN